MRFTPEYSKAHVPGMFISKDARKRIAPLLSPYWNAKNESTITDITNIEINHIKLDLISTFPS
jgi:hypothetical protein